MHHEVEFVVLSIPGETAERYTLTLPMLRDAAEDYAAQLLETGIAAAIAVPFRGQMPGQHAIEKLPL